MEQTGPISVASSARATPQQRLFVWQRALFWIGLIVMAGIAAWLRLATYERYLPFVDYTDEAVYVALAQELRGLSDETALREKYGNLPPLYYYFNAGVQNVVDLFKPHDWNIPAEYYPVLRQISAWMGVATALVIAVAAYQMAGPLAAWLAGMIWATSPIIVEYNNLAIPDPTVYLLTTVTLATALLAWRTGSMRWLLVCLLSAILVIYTKYWILSITAPFLLVAAYLGWRGWHSASLRRWAFVYASIIVVTVAFFVFVVDPTGGGGEKLSAFSATELVSRGLDPLRLSNNLWHSVYPVGYTSLWYVVPLALGALAWGVSARRGGQRLALFPVGLLAVYALLTLPLSAASSFVASEERMRHILPLSIAFFILWSAAIVQITWTLDHLLRKQTQGVRRLVPGVLVLALVAVLGALYIPRLSAIVAELNRPHIMNAVTDWFDGSPPRDGLVMQTQPSDVDRLWNRIWGAYAGDKPFEWWNEQPANFIDATPADFVERGITYFVLNDLDLQGKYNTPEVRAFLDDSWLIRTFPARAETAGSTTYVYRLRLPDERADWLAGEQIRLIAYDLSAPVAGPGETLIFRPYWQIERQPATNYSMFIHLYAAEETAILAQHDGELVPGGDRPTFTWTDLEEIYFGDTVAFTLPADLPAGDYRLALGVYDYVTFARLADEAGRDFFSIPLRIE